MKQGIIAIVIIGIIVSVTFNVSNSLQTGTVENCKVITLEKLQHISSDKDGMRTSYRYLVVTDKETFVCESSLLNGKFNNSDIFFHLKQDSTYTFKVVGYGKTFITDYRNILEVVK